MELPAEKARVARRDYLRRYFAERRSIMAEYFQSVKANSERYEARKRAQRAAYHQTMSNPARRAARRAYERLRYAAQRAGGGMDAAGCACV